MSENELNPTAAGHRQISIRLLWRDLFGREKTLASAGILIVGRSEGLGLSLPDPVVSRFHCAFIPLILCELCCPVRWHIADLGSRNGTYVNGCRITEPVVLKDQDVIQIGRTHLLVVSL